MGIHVIKMPDLGEGIAEVEVVAWHVQPGERVVEDQVLADVMTDKATVEIPSPVHGIVLALGGALGEALAVGAELIRIEVDGDGNLGAKKAAAAPLADTPVTPAPMPESTPPTTASAPAPAPESAAPATPTAAAPLPAPAPAFSRMHEHVTRASGDKPLAPPAVRQRARGLGIELLHVDGSGPAGRITHADLDAYVARGSHIGGGKGANGEQNKNDQRYAELQGEQAVPIIGLRRKIAEKMQDAKRRIPHFTYVEEIDVTDIEALRRQLNAHWGGERARLTFLPLLMRAIVLGVRSFPQLNARFDDDAGVVTRFNAVHIGIATQTEPGLMVPVVRHAEARDPWSSAAEVARLAEEARSGRALREELSGSTITITSLGALGGNVTTPVINAPEVAIVGVNRMLERAVVRDGAIVMRTMMNLSCSFDHRVIDGMLGAQFVQAIRGYLECPAILFVE